MFELSPHGVPARTMVDTTLPVAGSHEKEVHPFDAGMTGAGPCVQTAFALQANVPAHLFELSPHAVPVATGVCVTPVDGLHASVVHGLPSSRTGGGPVTHAPLPLHADAPPHLLLLSPHARPALAGA